MEVILSNEPPIDDADEYAAPAQAGQSEKETPEHLSTVNCDIVTSENFPGRVMVYLEALRAVDSLIDDEVRAEGLAFLRSVNRAIAPGMGKLLEIKN
jgi:hypothetical protein